MIRTISKTVVPRIQGTPLYLPLFNRLLHLLMPLYRAMGIKVEAVDDNSVTTTVRLGTYTRSHIGTLHASPLFTVGEMVGGIFVIHRYAALGYTPIAKAVTIDYLRKVRRVARARAVVSDEVLERLEDDIRSSGRGELVMVVEITDEAGKRAATMTNRYLVKS